MADTAPLLDLDTLTARPVIAIDGTKYEILSAEELSVIDSHRFGRWGRRIKELSEVDSEDAEKELNELVDLAARKVLVGVSDEIFAKLSGASRWAVVDLFTGLLLRRARRVAGAMTQAAGIEQNLIGEPSFPVFNASSVEPRRAGLLKRLARWSGLI